MSNNIVLDARNIYKKIGHHVIVNDVSLKLYQGDILGFVGPNGAGKTTTIKLLLGLQFFNSGSVEINGYDLKKNFSLAISSVGAIIENPDLYMYMSGYENLQIAAKLYGISEKRVLEVVRLVGLENKIYDKVRKYSLGMRQRLGIAQAIIHNPKLLILDEPMNGLDPEGIKDLKNLIIRLAKEEKMSVLISSHLLGELESFCNRICILSKGKILKDLRMDELWDETGKSNYVMEVSRINLENILYKFKVIDQTHIRINTTKDNLVNILKALLLNGVDIYEIRKEVTSLEEFFALVTKGV